MNEEILALAEELCCGLYLKSNGVFYPAHNIESFYRAAYNKAINDAADSVVGIGDASYIIRDLEME